MNCKIDYVLLTNNKIEIKQENIEAFYIEGKKLAFLENLIDIENKTYYRKTNEYIMLIDFKNKTCELFFDKTNKCKFDINSFFKNEYDEIILEYSFDDENKKIIITVKE